MRLFYFLCIGVVFSGWSCSGVEDNEAANAALRDFEIPAPPALPEDATELGEANAHMHERSFEELIGFFESPHREKWQRPAAVVEMLGDLEGKKVIDLGAGTGYFAFRLHEAGAKVIAAEVDDRFLDYLKEKRAELAVPESEFEVRKVFYDDPLLAPGEADIFFTVDTYHHIEGRDRYLNRVSSGLREGGKLMIIDFKKEETEHGPPVKIRIEADQIQEELAAAGFEDISIDNHTLPEQFIVTAIRPN